MGYCFAIGTRFIIKINIKESEPLTSQKGLFFTVENKDTSVSNVSKDEKPKKKTKSAYGRLAISSYTSFSSPTGKANHTLRYTMVYHAHQLGQKSDQLQNLIFLSDINRGMASDQN